MKQVLKKLIIENQEFIQNIRLYNRNIDFDSNGNYVFVGARRAGKTYFMYQIAQQLLAKGINIEQLLFINFEDERLIELKTENLTEIIEAYRELFDLQPICFFDEIQNIPAWEKFVRRLADKHFRLYVTGSNAKMLSKEMASVLGGRFFIKEIYPLNFTEFLKFNELELSKNFEYSNQQYDIKRLFSEYFYYGSFPEIIKFSSKKEYLSNLYQKVFYGDIITRYGIKNEFALKLLVKKIAESIMDETSFSRLKNIIKSVGIAVGTNTLIEYFDYLEESFLAFSLTNYKAKFTERETKKKFYFNDTGILNLFLFQPESKLLENLVFNYLRRSYGQDFYFYRDKVEADFYIPEKEIIQVAYNLDNLQTREREIRAIKEARANCEAHSFKIITYDNEETIQIDDYTIEVVPVWKWCLELDRQNFA